MICGCNDGSIFLQSVNYDNGMLVDDGAIIKSTGRQLQPRHSGLVKGLATTPVPGVMLSGGQDGSFTSVEHLRKRFPLSLSIYWIQGMAGYLADRRIEGCFRWSR